MIWGFSWCCIHISLMPITTKNKDKTNVVQSNCFLILKVREGEQKKWKNFIITWAIMTIHIPEYHWVIMVVPLMNTTMWSYNQQDTRLQIKSKIRANDLYAGCLCKLMHLIQVTYGNEQLDDTNFIKPGGGEKETSFYWTKKVKSIEVTQLSRARSSA